MNETVSITLDDRAVEVPAGELLIKAAQDRGTYIPRFCWHPRMNPVGMCRMCLVELDTPRGPAIVTSCTTPVTDGMVVKTESPTVVDAQAGVLEFLLINHPLDCPVCDRAGECPLQDQAMAYGPGESRFVEEKRHFRKPVPISDLVLLDRERCILCARCTRFCEEISGDPLIEFTARGYDTHIATFPDHPFASYFSGNTIEICPVGALTAAPYRFRARPWDLSSVETTCPHFSTGDRIALQSSVNEVVRVLGVDSDPTNRGWIADKTRFGHEYIGSPNRLTTPLIKNENGEHQPVSWKRALDTVANRWRRIQDGEGGSALSVIGGARLTNEDAYALSKFARTVLGTNHLDAQLEDGLDPQFLAGTVDRAQISDLEQAGSIMVWGPDLKEEFPTLYLRVRRAAQEQGIPLVVVHPRATGLDDRAMVKLTYRPGRGADLLDELTTGSGNTAAAREVLEKGPVVGLVGRPGLGEDPRLAEAIAAFVRGFPAAKLLPLARRGNVFGALDMGLSPNLLPGRVSVTGEGSAQITQSWGAIPEFPGKDTRGILEGCISGNFRSLLLVGADPARDVPDSTLAQQALEQVPFLVAFDQFLTESSRQADVVFPTSGFAEKEGTVTNLEGRVQKLNPVAPGPGQTRPDWSILVDLADRLGTSWEWSSAREISAEIARVAPAYAGVSWERLERESPDGLLLPLSGEGHQPLQYVPVASAGSRRGHDLVLHSARVMYDDGVMLREGSSLRELAPGARLFIHPHDASRLGLGETDWAVVTTENSQQELEVRHDPSLHRGVVYVPFNQPGMTSLGSGLSVSVKKK